MNESTETKKPHSLIASNAFGNTSNSTSRIEQARPDSSATFASQAAVELAVKIEPSSVAPDACLGQSVKPDGMNSEEKSVLGLSDVEDEATDYAESEQGTVSANGDDDDDMATDYGDEDTDSDLEAHAASSNDVKRESIVEDNSLATSPTNLTCQVCLKIFKTERGFKNHQYVHTTGIPFQCETCLQQFATQRILFKHVQHHSLDNRPIAPLTCPICTQSFTSLMARRRHEYSYHSSKPGHSCTQCPANYQWPSELKIHFEKAHVKVGKFICSVCGMKFKQQRVLTKHKEQLICLQAGNVEDLIEVERKMEMESSIVGASQSA